VQDLLVLELIIATLLFLAIVRPFIKSFQGIDGIAALPTIALAASIAVFPAYGYRPEFLPLAGLAFAMFLGSIPRLVDIFRRLRTDDYGERGFVRLAIGLLFLTTVTAFAITYAPRGNAKETMGYREALVHDEIRDVTLSLRYYPKTPNAIGERRPIILLAPPITGSVSVTDFLCESLAERGFFVESFSRVGMDFPAYLPDGKRTYPKIETLAAAVSASIWGGLFADAARAGAKLERERAADIAFLVNYSRIAAGQGVEPYGGADPYCIIVAGFDFGGAGATIYAASAEASSIAAVIAVEGPLLSALKGEGAGVTSTSQEGTSAFSNWLAGIYTRLKIERIIGTGVVPAPIVPTLFLVSDQVREPKARDGRYATILRSLRSAKVPCALASMDGAGPFDYSAVSEEYPVYSAIMPGLNKQLGTRDVYLEGTAALIANFVDTVTASAAGPRSLLRSTFGNEIRLEAGGPWTSTDVASILRP
jgi:hypothetical protein